MDELLHLISRSTHEARFNSRGDKVSLYWKFTDLYSHIAYRLTDKSLKVLEHLARRGSVWPEACGAAINDLRTQLTRDDTDKSGEIPVNRSNGSTPSAHDHATPTPSPYVNARTMNQTGIPILADLGRARVRNCTDTDQTARPDTRPVTQERTPRETRDLDDTSLLTTRNFEGQSSDNHPSIPPPGDYLYNGQIFDQPFHFSNDGSEDPFAGFDIPFWLGQDQYSGMINEWQ